VLTAFCKHLGGVHDERLFIALQLRSERGRNEAMKLTSRQNHILVFSIPFVFLSFALSLYALNQTLYFNLFGILETGFFEWIQFASYVLASILGFRTLSFLSTSPPPPWGRKIVIFIFSIACAFIALEEISWGQHVFLWSTPDFLSTINLQNETNFHNLAVIQGNSIQVMAYAFVGLFGGLSWVLRRRKDRLSVRDFIFPEWYFSSYFLPTGVLYSQLVDLGIGIEHQETFESLLGFGFLAVAIGNLIKAKNGYLLIEN
jgi:hypothetical protein